MLLYRNLSVSLGSDEPRLPAMIERRLRLKPGAIRQSRIVKKSLDARRGRKPRFVYSLAMDVGAKLEKRLLSRRDPVVQSFDEDERVRLPAPEGNTGQRPVVIGAGPAGLFCALQLARVGRPPIVIERGPDVTERSKRWFAFAKGGEFDPECNLLFGEGGAGAYSDGKLYTRVSDPRVEEVLRVLASHGAPGEILYDAKPHVGSNLLPSIIRRMREQLISQGVEFRFSTRMERLILSGEGDDCRVSGVELAPGGVLETDAVFLGTGHSARDVYRMLHDVGIQIEPKAFQMGVRVEHPQTLIDSLQYGESTGHPALPPAEYQLVAKRRAGDVFSFCMCPGGEVLPSTEKAGFICVNGASKYKRKSPFANSGFVVTVEPKSFPNPEDPLSGLLLQEQVEQAAARAAGVPFGVPALRLTDFVAGTVSESLPKSSYPFPLVPSSLDSVLPEAVITGIREGMRIFGRRLPGFLTEDAVVVAPESRSSSPLRIVRDDDTLVSPSAAGLYPMGEGAGYAGGIVSAAIDGLHCAEAWCREPVR